MAISTLESDFDILWLNLYPDIDLDTEVRLIPSRKYRFDYVHLPSRVAIELNGGIWGKGGHNTGRGLERDYAKLNLAQSMGYRVFQLSPSMVNQQWLGLIANAINLREKGS